MPWLHLNYDKTEGSPRMQLTDDDGETIAEVSSFEIRADTAMIMDSGYVKTVGTGSGLGTISLSIPDLKKFQDAILPVTHNLDDG